MENRYRQPLQIQIKVTYQIWTAFAEGPNRIKIQMHVRYARKLGGRAMTLPPCHRGLKLCLFSIVDRKHGIKMVGGEFGRDPSKASPPPFLPRFPQRRKVSFQGRKD